MIETKLSDQFETDKWIWDMFDLDSWFDPCPFNNDPVVDGLSVDWKDRTFVNPPYSNPLPWVRKALEENRKGKRVLLLLKFDCTTTWFKELISGGGRLLLINERLKYRTGKTSPFSSALVYLGVDEK